jgi:hypothetical protein
MQLNVEEIADKADMIGAFLWDGQNVKRFLHHIKASWTT